jgi:hypothetical protein
MKAGLAPIDAATRRGAQTGLNRAERDGGPSPFNLLFARFVAIRGAVMAAVALAVGGGVCDAQSVGAAAQTVPTPQEQTVPVTQTAAASDGLSDLDAMTFSCPRAGLNAAARQAAKVPSQGTYQFAYFRIINDAHHAAYEVHFKSNYEGEAELKYCVAIYCQQGWDPRTTRASVTLIGGERQHVAGAAHGAECGAAPAPVKRRLKR